MDAQKLNGNCDSPAPRKSHTAPKFGQMQMRKLNSERLGIYTEIFIELIISDMDQTVWYSWYGPFKYSTTSGKI